MNKDIRIMLKHMNSDDNRIREYKKSHGITAQTYEVYNKDGNTVFQSESYGAAANYIDDYSTEENPLFLYNTVTKENEEV